MLKIQIFDEPSPGTPKPLILKTRLVDGIYETFACDRAGIPLPCGLLWSLHPDGRQQDHRTINPVLGLDLDGLGKIRHT